MAPFRLFRIDGHELALGGQRCARLRLWSGEVPRLDSAHWSHLWGNGGNVASWYGEAGLQRALANPNNRELVELIAGSTKLRAVLREVGDGGGCDLAIFHEQDHATRLTLVDCKGAADTKRKAQLVQAHRIVLATVPNLWTEPPLRSVRLVMLAPWRPAEPPDSARARPRWHGDANIDFEAEWWGYVPFRCGEEEYVYFGGWSELSASPELRALHQRRTAARIETVQPGRNIAIHGLLLETHRIGGVVRGTLRISAKDYASAMGTTTKAKSTAAAVFIECRSAGGLRSGTWQYIGETNDKGFVRLVWERTGRASGQNQDLAEAESELLAFLREVISTLDGV